MTKNIKEHFSVTYEKGFDLLFWILFTIVVFICILQSAVNGIEPLMYISFAILILPFAFALFWFKKYKITVNGDKITIRKAFGLTYTIDVSEIVKITWFVRYISFSKTSTKKPKSKIPQHDQLPQDSSDGNFVNENIIIKTKNRRFTVSTPMSNFKKMSEYLTTHIEPEKIDLK